MDIATIIGILFGGALIFGAIITGAGGLAVFVNIPSLGITIGGMIAATLIHFSLPQVLGIFTIVKKTIIQKVEQPGALIQKMVNYAAINRRDGALALEQEIGKVDLIRLDGSAGIDDELKVSAIILGPTLDLKEAVGRNPIKHCLRCLPHPRRQRPGLVA